MNACSICKVHNVLINLRSIFYSNYYLLFEEGDNMAKDESRRNSDGYFRSTFYYQGKQYAATSKASQKDADKKAALKLDKLERGEVGVNGKMTVERWAKEWLEVYKKPVVAEKCYKRYKRYIDNIIVPEIGNIRMLDVKDIHLQKVLNTRAGYSYSEVKSLYDVVRSIFKKARLALTGK